MRIEDLGLIPLLPASGADPAVGGTRLSAAARAGVREAAGCFCALSALQEAASARLERMGGKPGLIVANAEAGCAWALALCPNARPVLYEKVLPSPGELRAAVQASDIVLIPGRCLMMPLQSALLFCEREYWQVLWAGVAPNHGLGRGYKIGKEEIWACVRGLEAYPADYAQTLARCLSMAAALAQAGQGEILETPACGYPLALVRRTSLPPEIRAERCPAGWLLHPLSLTEAACARVMELLKEDVPQ